MTQKQSEIVAELLGQHGQTYAEQAGITLRDKPSALYRLLVLATLLSTRINADLAVDAARELSRAGWRTPRAMLESSWQQRVDALGRAHYKRYDESTATRLAEGAQLLLERYGGDLRRLRDEADGDVHRIHDLLMQFPGIGPTGARIFCREAQGVWPELRPYFDERAIARAADLGLPSTPPRLGRLVADRELTRLSAALVRSALAG
jgi:endonuclease III